MSLEKQYNETMYMCDDCGDTSVAYKDFDDLKRECKADGWLITKDEDTDEWVHLCPDCVSKLPTLAP